jgi:polyphosphate kinase
MSEKSIPEFINREISWLGFNDRVLQEAADPSVPLIERLRFLGIFSNNLDEFFRVRVATLRRLVTVGEDEVKDYFEMDPKRCLSEIQSTVIKMQAKFERVYQSIIDELETEKIFIVNETEISHDQEHFCREYFEDVIRPYLVPIMLENDSPFPQIKDKVIYMALRLAKKGKTDFALMEVPSEVKRFVQLPTPEGTSCIILIDDIIRLCLPKVFEIFEYETTEAYTIKITRDAELDIKEDVSQSLMQKLEDSIRGRKTGNFTRFVFDSGIPEDLFAFLVKKLKLNDSQNLIPGGRYHNFKDFISFPSLKRDDLNYEVLPALRAPEFAHHKSIFTAIRTQDIFLTYPYQSFGYIIDLLREAAIDPMVKAIKINIYRVAKNSRIMNALINAAHNGKEVVVSLELKARFDEKHNLYWSSKLQEEGVKVIFGVEDLKVHSKLIVIEREEEGKTQYYTHIGTGNFHEKTAQIYTDHSLLTAHEGIGKEVSQVFEFLDRNYLHFEYEHLLVSPYTTRSSYAKLIENEIKNAKAGKKAYIHFKLNNLVDREMIELMYKASQAGVKIRGVVRGICSLIPGKPGLSENIEIKSIVDRFLEHTRSFIFANDGNELYYISSADWMSRNLDSRVEVSVPIYDKHIKKILKDFIHICFKDNCKSRVIDKLQLNLYTNAEKKTKIRAQYHIYNYFKALAKKYYPTDPTY